MAFSRPHQCELCAPILTCNQMPCLQSITGVKPMSGSVPTSVAFQSPGSVTQWMTAWITQMKTPHTVPAGAAGPASSSVTMVAASLRAGSVMSTMIAETIPMSPSTNAVSSLGWAHAKTRPVDKQMGTTFLCFHLREGSTLSCLFLQILSLQDKTQLSGFYL